MTEALTISLISFAALSLSAIITLASMLFARISRLENRIQASESYNNSLWIWARDSIDKYFKWARPEAPALLPLPERKGPGND